jgi:hypothetical protein
MSEISQIQKHELEMKAVIRGTSINALQYQRMENGFNTKEMMPTRFAQEEDCIPQMIRYI